MANILVTGGAGFIGSHVAEMVLNQGHKVRVIDNLRSGKEINIAQGIEFINGDIRDPETVKNALKDVDYVLHFAAQASVVISTKDPILDSSINVGGTVNLLEQSYISGIKHFIFASTGGAIYGNAKKLPANEDTKKSPLSPYGVSKAAAEMFCDYYNRMKIPVSILRFANVYGPRQDIMGEAGVISIFLGKIKAGKPITIYGDGSATRDYVFVTDVAKLCMEILDKPLNEVVNVGTGKETSVQSIIQTIQDVTNMEITKINENLREGEVERICLDISRVTKKTSWSPQTALSQGISEVWDWINS